MTRLLVIIAAAGFVLAVVCFALAGRFAGDLPFPAFIEAMHWSGGDDRPSWRWHGGWGGHHHSWFDASGPAVSRTLAWSGGDSLIVEVPAEVSFTQGPTTSLTVSGPKGAVDHLVVRDGRIQFDSGMRWVSPLKIVMTAPGITKFDLSGAASLSIAGYKQDALNIDLSGAGAVSASGEARHVALDISGTGHADLSGMAVEDADVDISGAGDARIAPKASADIEISGAGAVTLLTRPAKLTTDVSGFGQIVQAGGG